MSEYDPPFEPTSSPETARQSVEFESINVCRVVALGAAFGSARGLSGLERELQAMGLPEYLAGDSSTGVYSWRTVLVRRPSPRSEPTHGQPEPSPFSCRSLVRDLSASPPPQQQRFGSLQVGGT